MGSSSRERNRFERTFFVYNNQKHREEDDPKDAILYFYPPSVDVAQQIALVGGIIGTMEFCIEVLEQTPSLVSLTTCKFAMLKTSHFILGLSTAMSEPEQYVSQRLHYLWNIFCFFQGSFWAVQQRTGAADFLRELNRIWDCYVSVVLSTDDPLSLAFGLVPYRELSKSESGAFLEASHILQTAQHKPGVIGGVLMNKNKVLCTQLSNEITRQLLLLMTHKQNFPCVEITPEFDLPGGIRLVCAFLTPEELSSLGPRSQARRQSGSGKASVQEQGNEASFISTPETSMPVFSTPKPDSHSKSGAGLSMVMESAEVPEEEDGGSDEFLDADQTEAAFYNGRTHRSCTEVDGDRTSVGIQVTKGNDSHLNQTLLSTLSRSESNIEEIKLISKSSEERQNTDVTSEQLATGHSVKDASDQTLLSEQCGDGLEVASSSYRETHEASDYQSDESDESDESDIADNGNRHSGDFSSAEDGGADDERNTEVSELYFPSGTPVRTNTDWDLSKSSGTLQQQNPSSLSVSANDSDNVKEKESVHTQSLKSHHSESKNHSVDCSAEEMSGNGIAKSARMEVTKSDECLSGIPAKGICSSTAGAGGGEEFKKDSIDLSADGDVEADGNSHFVQPQIKSSLSVKGNTFSSSDNVTVTSCIDFVSSRSTEPTILSLDNSQTVLLNGDSSPSPQQFTSSETRSVPFNLVPTVIETELKERAGDSLHVELGEVRNGASSVLTVSDDMLSPNKERLSFEMILQNSASSGSITQTPAQNTEMHQQLRECSTEPSSSDLAHSTENLSGCSSSPTILSSPTGVPDKGDDSGLDGRKQVLLYLQGHMDTLLVLILKDLSYATRDTVNSLWKTSLARLAELDFAVSGTNQEADSNASNRSSYLYLKYNTASQVMQGTAMQAETPLASELVSSSILLHDTFTSMPDVQDILCKTHTACCFGHKTLSSETFFQVMASRGGGFPDPRDYTLSLDQIADRKLYTDHSTTLF